MMRIVELVPEEEFADLKQLKHLYVDRIVGSLSSLGYVAIYVDQSEYYSYERKITVETNAPAPVLNRVIQAQDTGGRKALCVLVE